MKKLLIFGGTTEGRMLAEFCRDNGIAADVSVTTDYGAELLGEDELIGVLTGKRDSSGMAELIRSGGYILTVDATHPYALEASRNIRAACEAAGSRYCRLIRERSEISGTCAESTDELTELLNRTDKVILSTLGSKELPELAKINDRKMRVWLRVLPAEGIVRKCTDFGFDAAHVIVGNGPFTVEENKRHILESGAKILVTKESGKAGGYPEKLEAARQCGIETITLARPREDGFTFGEITEIIRKTI